MFEPFFNVSIKKTNFNKTTLTLIVNILLPLSTVYFIIQYIWVGFFIDVSLKNYLNYFLWNVASIFYSTSLYGEVFVVSNLNFGCMILLNDHPIYWSVELHWIIEQFLNNPSKSTTHNPNQLENLILHLINNFFVKLEIIFSFGILFLMIGFFRLSKVGYVNKSLAYTKFFFKKGVLTQIILRLIFIKILMDFLFLFFVPILFIYFILFYFKQIWFYSYLISLSFNKIIFTYKWPNFFLIVSNINIDVLTSKDILFIREKIKQKYLNELKYHYNNTLIQFKDVFKFFFFKKNEMIDNIITSYSSNNRLDSTSILYLIFILIKSCVFYLLKSLNYLVILINLFFYFKLLSFYVVNNQFFYTLKKANKWIFLKILLWKPLFKRLSYYGFFSKTRECWSRFSSTNKIKFL